jgi:hypothetical protein
VRDRGTPAVLHPPGLPAGAGPAGPSRQDQRPGPAPEAGKGRPAAGTKVTAAASLVTLLATAFPGRAIHVVADAAYRGPALKHLPPMVTWTCRLHANPVLYDLAPPRPPSTRGRPRRKGERLGAPPSSPPPPAGPATVRIYGRDQHIALAGITCLWYGCLDTRTVRVILVRDDRGLLVLVTTDLDTPVTALPCSSTPGHLWYTRHGHHWAGITARISKGSTALPTPEQTNAVLAAWHAAAA